MTVLPGADGAGYVSRAFPTTQRYGAEDEREVTVLIDGKPHAARLLASNGPRTRVSVLIDGKRYTRWVFAADVLETR
jgi:hypothetical protein